MSDDDENNKGERRCGMSEIEQLRDENRRLREDRDAAIRQLADEGRTRGAVEFERDRLRNGCRSVANAMRDWSARHGYQAKIDALATNLQALAQPAPAPAEGQQPEPASDGEVVANKWKAAITEAAVVNWTLTAENENDPRKAVNALLCYAQQVALDPQVSEDARTLRDTYKPEVERLRKVVQFIAGGTAANPEPLFDGIGSVAKDIYEFALEVAEDNGRDEYMDADFPEALCRLIEATLAASKGGVQHG